MSFLDTVERARALLELNGRVSLRALACEFGLEDDALHALGEELMDVQQVAALEGKVLAWMGSRREETTPALYERLMARRMAK